MKQSFHVRRMQNSKRFMEFGNIWMTLNMDLSFVPAIQHLKLYITDIPIKNDWHIKFTCYILFVIAKEWKSLKCPSTVDSLNKWYIHTKKY